MASNPDLSQMDVVRVAALNSIVRVLSSADLHHAWVACCANELCSRLRADATPHPQMSAARIVVLNSIVRMLSSADLNDGWVSCFVEGVERRLKSPPRPYEDDDDPPPEAQAKPAKRLLRPPLERFTVPAGRQYDGFARPGDVLICDWLGVPIDTMVTRCPPDTEWLNKWHVVTVKPEIIEPGLATFSTPGLWHLIHLRKVGTKYLHVGAYFPQSATGPRLIFREDRLPRCHLDRLYRVIEVAPGSPVDWRSDPDLVAIAKKLGG